MMFDDIRSMMLLIISNNLHDCRNMDVSESFLVSINYRLESPGYPALKSAGIG